MQDATANGVQDSVDQWLSSITDSGVAEKKKKKKHKHKHHNDLVDDVTVEMDGTATACNEALKNDKKKLKSKERSADQEVVVEDSEVMAVEQKKKRKSNTTVDDAPVEKKIKLEADDETEPLVKRHKKKKVH